MDQAILNNQNLLKMQNMTKPIIMLQSVYTGSYNKLNKTIPLSSPAKGKSLW